MLDTRQRKMKAIFKTAICCMVSLFLLSSPSQKISSSQSQTYDQLSTWTFTQNADIARSLLAEEYRRGGYLLPLTDEIDQRYARIASTTGLNALPLLSGKYLLNGQHAKTDLAIVRAILYADYRTLVSREKNMEPVRYGKVTQDLLLSPEFEDARMLYIKIEKISLEGSSIDPDRMIARAFELVTLVDRKMIYAGDLDQSELLFASRMRPLINAKGADGKSVNFSDHFFDPASRMNQVFSSNAAMRSVPEEEKDAPALSNLLIALNLTDVGIEIKNGERDSRQSLRKVRELLPAFSDDGVGKIYLYGGLYPMSDLSRKVHQVPDAGRHFVHDGNSVVAVEGYNTKRKKVGEIELKDSFGNPFSISGMEKWNEVLSDSDVNEDMTLLMKEAKRLNIEMAADFIPWFSPSAVDHTNYKMTFYSEVSDEENAHFRGLGEEEKRKWMEKLLERDNNHCVVRIKEHGVERVIRVMHLRFFGDHSADQVMLNPFSEEVREYYKRSIKRLIDAGFSEVRVDQAALLLKANLGEYLFHRDNDDMRDMWKKPEIWQEVISYAKEYAKSQGKSIKFNMETYDQNEQAVLFGCGADSAYDGDFFHTFYYIGREAGTARALDAPFKKAIWSKERALIYPSNFDQMSLKAMTRAQKGMNMLIIALSHLGVKSMVDLREYLGQTGHLTPIVGGNNNGKDGHPFPSAEEIVTRSDFEGIKRLVKESEWRKIAKEFNSIVTTKKADSVHILNNSNTERFFSFMWKTETGSWQVMVIDVMPWIVKGSVTVEIPAPYGKEKWTPEDKNIFCVMADGTSKELKFSRWEKENANSPNVIEIPFEKGEEYKIATVVPASSTQAGEMRNKIFSTARIVEAVEKSADELSAMVKSSVVSYPGTYGGMKEGIRGLDGGSKLRICVPAKVFKKFADITLSLRGMGFSGENNRKMPVPFEIVVTGATSQDKELFEAINKDEIKRALNVSGDLSISVISEAEILAAANEFPLYGYDTSTPLGRARIIRDMYEGRLEDGEYLAVVTEDVAPLAAERISEVLEREENASSRISFMLPIKSAAGESNVYIFADILNVWLDGINKGKKSIVQKVLPPIISPAEMVRRIESAVMGMWKVLSAA